MGETATDAACGAGPEARLIAIGAREGFYRRLGDRHSALFSNRGRVLLVTFENLDHVVSQNPERLPWGHGLAEDRGWSLLGLLARDWSWYRDRAVLDFFDDLRDSGFFDDFDRVIFYGASMGAYAACAFSSAAPGAEVIAISPQATLDRELVSWESRYRKAWRRDFSGRYGYAPAEVARARRLVLVYDPAAPLDAMHAALFRGHHVTRLRCRFMGHRIMSLWRNMGVLRETVDCLLAPDLDARRFHALMRARHGTPRYQKELLAQVTARRRDDLILRVCRAVLARGRAPQFRRALRAAEERQAAAAARPDDPGGRGASDQRRR